jgi:hypothetical protein
LRDKQFCDRDWRFFY